MAHAAVKVQPAPHEEPLSTEFAVEVGGSSAPVYLAQVLGISVEARRKYNGGDAGATMQTPFTSFDMSAPTEVKVTFQDAVQKAVLLPSSKRITPTIKGNQVIFKITEPGQYVLEINDNWSSELQIFANPLEAGVPDRADPNVIYFGPGIHHVQNIVVPSGKTLYIADGAILYSHYEKGVSNRMPVIMLDGDNIRLCGRGIVDASKCPFHTRPLLGVHGKNIEVEGITLRDSSIWTVPVGASENVKFTNVKIFGWRGNSDGIDICGSRNVVVEKSYFRTADDLVVIKTYVMPPQPFKFSRDFALEFVPCDGETRNVLVKQCVLWNDLAHALSIGAEVMKDVDNIRFTDCDVVRDKGREWLLRVFQCDAAHISNIRFDHIRIEESQHLASVWINKANWSRDDERGRISNITFDHITVSGSNTAIELSGFDAEHAVKDVSFDDVVLNGAPLNAKQIKSNAFVYDVKVKP